MFWGLDEYSEESLEKHDEELNRVKQFHQDNYDLFDKIHQREQLWKQFLEFEVRLLVYISALYRPHMF